MIQLAHPISTRPNMLTVQLSMLLISNNLKRKLAYRHRAYYNGCKICRKDLHPNLLPFIYIYLLHNTSNNIIYMLSHSTMHDLTMHIILFNHIGCFSHSQEFKLPRTRKQIQIKQRLGRQTNLL